MNNDPSTQTTNEVTHSNHSDVLAELAQLLDPASIITDPDITSSYSSDHATGVAVGKPLAVLLPKSTEDVSRSLAIAHRYNIPVVPRGAGSGLAGGANAIDGSLVMSLARMTKILEIDPINFIATVEPGVINKDLKAEAERFGLSYPPDPASFSFSTVGGNIATNAGGLCCVKYGVTRDYVLGLEVVMADGTVMNLGRRTKKGVAGLDLTGLIVGSEGTLAVITKATLRLVRQLPKPAGTLVAVFNSLTSLGEAITEISKSCTPSLLEVMDDTTLAAVEKMTPMGLHSSIAAMLIAQSDLDGEAGVAELDLIKSIAERSQATEVYLATDAYEADALLQARRLALRALERLGKVLLDDVCVPTSRIAEMMAEISAVAERYSLTIGTFGHGGDGNLHPTIVMPTDDAGKAAAEHAFSEMVGRAIALGGTISGEHGVGLLKKRYQDIELGDHQVKLIAEVKRAFDPNWILNPTKLVDQ
ncbi:FAD-binding oxidoreductase [Ferrimicrobium acidiphilum]|uniref:FAD-binding oxidoreductase n=1 Tax=Ferrimicrobium acidiphilum TaxID=121039 RepID=UPI0023F1EDFC|nr:FAD-linked oxidase C-terminal domain-containing protein [Ferrimicrobium acidiphilum]